MEKVIFRTEWDKYRKDYNYLAIFPETSANRGYIAFTPFHFVEDQIIFEPFGEMSLAYYYDCTKLIRRNTDIARKCKQAIERYYNTEYRVMERINW